MNGFRNAFPNTDTKVLVLFDVRFSTSVTHVMNELTNKDGYANIVIGQASRHLEQTSKCASPPKPISTISNHLDFDDALHIPKETSSIHHLSTNTDRQFAGGLQFCLPNICNSIEEYVIFFVGAEDCTQLLNITMRYNQVKVVVYNPDDGNITPLSQQQVNKALMKRYVQVQKVRNSNIIGIVAGTLGVDRYLDVIQGVKRLIDGSGRKSYTFVVGKINVPKLSNFAEIEAFVLVS